MRHGGVQSARLRGFTLIEAAVVLCVFSLITISFYETWSLGTKHIMNAKYRLGGSAIADQQMEIVRALKFDDIGTTTGIPSGTLTEDKTINANNTIYQVHTVVQYVDDSTDGTLGAGTDLAPNDYKKVTLTVSWGGASDSEQVEMTSLFSLDGVESVAAGTGILSINVLNGAGNAVSGADVHITNTAVSPSVNITASTDTNGNLMFPGAKASVQGYHITVSKAGYYGNMTYSPYPTSVFKPVNVHASVVAGSLTQTTLVSDALSEILFSSVDSFGTALPDIDFTIDGGLKIGVDASTSASVYDFSETTKTDASGTKDFPDRSAGGYTVVLDPSEVARYEFLRLEPQETTFGTINLLAGSTKSVQMILADKTVSSVLITVLDSTSTPAPIAGASVRLRDSASGYDTTLTADAYGKAYFPVTATSLVAGTYTIEVNASGYTSVSDSIVVSGTKLEEKTISL